MRGTSLATLVTMLKHHIGDSATVGTAQDAEYKRILSDKQMWLASEFDWPFLQKRFDVDAVPSQRYYLFPDINIERPFLVETKWSSRWQEVDYAIGSEEYNYIDSDNGQVLDPIQRFQLIQDDSLVQKLIDDGMVDGATPLDSTLFEVWPLSSTQQALRFTGQRQLDTLVEVTDTADLDDEMLVLFCAADKLFRLKQADAQLKMQAAQQRMLKLRAVLPVREQTFCLGGYQRREYGRRKVGGRLAPPPLVLFGDSGTPITINP